MNWKIFSYIQTPTASIISDFRSKLTEWEDIIFILLWKNNYNPKDFNKPYIDNPTYMNMIFKRRFIASLYD